LDTDKLGKQTQKQLKRPQWAEDDLQDQKRAPAILQEDQV